MSKLKKREPSPFALRAVYLREAKQWMADDFDPTLPGQAVSGLFRLSGHRVDVQEAIADAPGSELIKTCRFTTKFEFRYRRTQEDEPSTDEQLSNEQVDKNLLAEITASITVDYLIESSEAPSQDKLQEWAAGNALVHCWPYWREFCHSTLVRMNLPITMIPLMNISPTKD